MRAYIAFLSLILLSAPAVAATAVWTGRQEQVQTVTGKSAWNCQYQYNGQYFWRIYETSCPSSIEVQ
jgi:hypothetical protein